MKAVALISGGKDSCFNVMHCVAHGHEIVALANLYPCDGLDEIDSYMYQTVGHKALPILAECFDLPLYRAPITGKPVDTGLSYKPTAEDETEDLYHLLRNVITKHPDIKAISVGAIESNYQRIRVANIAQRLGLECLTYLWKGDQDLLLDRMIQCGLEAIIIKVAGAGLKQEHLGRTLIDMQSLLRQLNRKFGLHVCGEGGEYESFVLDCPLFLKKKMILGKIDPIEHSTGDVAYLDFEVHTMDKETSNDDWRGILLASMTENP